MAFFAPLAGEKVYITKGLSAHGGCRQVDKTRVVLNAVHYTP
jgi:hypothetical protein